MTLSEILAELDALLGRAQADQAAGRITPGPLDRARVLVAEARRLAAVPEARSRDSARGICGLVDGIWDAIAVARSWERR